LIAAPPEPLTSQFQVTHGMLLNVLSRPTDGCRAMQELIARCHEMPKAKKALTRRGWQLFRSLVERGIIEFVPQTAEGAKVRVNLALQDDFSMNQTLSLYVHDTLPLMDPQAPDYALVVLTLVESILEDPDLILRKQLDKVKGQAIAEMKMQGIEYNQRMEELEKLEYPKPNRDFIYSTFNAFAAAIRGSARRTSGRNPSRGRCSRSSARSPITSRSTNCSARKVFSCGTSPAFTRSSRKPSPTRRRTTALREMELYLSTMLRQIDSSLLEEWEKMRDPNYLPRGRGRPKSVRPEPRKPPATSLAIRRRSPRRSATASSLSSEPSPAATSRPPSPPSTLRPPPKMSLGPLSVSGAHGRLTTSSTRAFDWIPKRVTCVTPTSRPPKTNVTGAFSKC
jgi:hypothetical protein